MILPSLGLFWCLTCLGDAVTYCDINFFNFWTFLRNCDTGAIQSKTSQVIRSDVSSHIESDMDICFEKNWTICWAGALGGIARAELPSPLEQKKGLARPHGRTQTRYHTFGSDFEFLLAVPNMVPYADILKVFLMAQVFGWEGGCLWDESWSQNLFGSFWHFKVFQTLHMHCHYTRPTLLDSFLFYSILTLRPWSPLSMFHTWKWFYVRKGWKKKSNPSQCPFLLPETNRNRSMEPLDEWRHVERGLVSSQRRAWSLAKPSEAPRELEMRAFSQDLRICIVLFHIYIYTYIRLNRIYLYEYIIYIYSLSQTNVSCIIAVSYV